ncbi:restriction endonuclease subunit S [Elizabethkingia anophelis]|uniref:restriction endonuclease subunit S n=1 Tax=Elizabethkingia anophelis TaxID=1117645 RepID=UPI001370006B|nr:restriction endonuclease subunit S [Elizabethkingia anophelis]MCT4228427.1 restriction endonuclease subunit S [Elizabethkingia anophelis]MCT4239153.1 restriction endonuclease subunit S [Elizabethkingia anophelis]MCT4282276.1 restriction endonuclease subunit S [Elizabethkingia anophelis]MCT4292861.1 restriction endonuclease subunit S [Elizabethkingia anophelis]MYY28157.1 restriction endonuclease subunit S [Elizabethkingia anophelis]
MEVPFKSRKLRDSIRKVTDRAKNQDLDLDSLPVYGVTKESGVIVTGKEVGKNLGEYYYFSGQKIAYNPYRANIGSIGLTASDFRGLMSPAYVIFEVDGTIYPEFLLLYLKCNIGQGLIKWYGDRGGIRSSLRISDLGEIDFPDITYEEQKDFYIDYYTKKLKIDESFEELNHQEELLERLKKNLLEEAIRGDLTKNWRKNRSNALDKEYNSSTNGDKKPFKGKVSFSIPKEWKWMCLKDLTSIQNGYAFKSYMYSNQGVRLLRNTNIYNGKIDWSEVVYYPEEDIKALSRYHLEVDDIVISLDRPIISSGLKIAIIKKEDLPAMLLQRVGRISSSILKINHLFLYYWFNSTYFTANLNIGEGLGVPHISTKEIESMKIAVPSDEEQEEIVRIISATLVLYDNLILEIVNKKIDISILLELYIAQFLGAENSSFLHEKNDKKEANKFIRSVKYNRKTTFMELVDLLKKHGELHAEDLWKMSKHYDNKNIDESIDKFYADLKKKIEVDKTVKEVINKKGYLELV